jgi:Tfp pilus assembly protein PilF
MFVIHMFLARLHRAHAFLLGGFFLALSVSTVNGQAGPGVDNTKGLPDNRIEGRIFFPSGNTRTPIRIRLRGDRGEQSTNSDRDGRFEFRGLRPGRYVILVEGGELYQSVSDTVDVSPVASGSSQGDMPSQMATLNIRLQLRTSPDSGPGVVTSDLSKIPKEAVDLYNAALKSVNDGDRKKATELLKKAISIYPEFAAALNGLGVQYLRLGENDKALEAFDSALKISPNSVAFQLNRGIALLSLKKFAEAEVELQKVVSENDTSALAHLYLGRALVGLNRLDEAEKEFNRSLAIGGADVVIAHRYLGGIYVQRGEKQKAIAELEAYLKSAPDSKEADRIKALISDLQKP